PRHGARFSPGRGGPARWRHVPLRRADELQRVRVTRTATGGDGERLQDELSRLLPARGDRDGDAVGAMLLGLERRRERDRVPDRGRRPERADTRDERRDSGGRCAQGRAPDGLAAARVAPHREPGVGAVEAHGDREGARPRDGVGIAAPVAVPAPLPGGRLPIGAGTPGGVLHPPLGETLGAAGTATRHEEGRGTTARRETALIRAGERTAGEPERLAGPPAERRPVALLGAVDRTVAAERAGGRVEMALLAGEGAARETERRAARAAERI